MESGREQDRGKEDEGGKEEDTRQKTKDCNKKDIHKYGKSSMKENPHCCSLVVLCLRGRCFRVYSVYQTTLVVRTMLIMFLLFFSLSTQKSKYCTLSQNTL